MGIFAEESGIPGFSILFIITINTIINMSETLNIIKDAFEGWYNRKLPTGEKVSVVISYSDVQKLSVKAYHTIRMEVQAVGIEEGKSYVTPLFMLQENYNHGVTSEQEAKDGLTRKLLEKMFDYPESTVACAG